MKKGFRLLAAAIGVSVIFQTACFAADADILLISGPEDEVEATDLDDIQLNNEYIIDGYGRITFTDAEFWDEISGDQGWFGSGVDAEYMILKVMIINTTKKDKNFLQDVNVEVTFDEDYVYGGFAYQLDPNKNQDLTYIYAEEENTFSIQPMYEGHYLFGCKLPNAVVNGSESLSMKIKMDGNEYTYHMRK